MNSNHQNLNQRLLALAAAAAALLLVFAGYHTLRRGAGRFFGDFFYPYLAVARAAYTRLSDQTLLAYNRLELAARVKQLQEVNRRLAAQAASASELIEENAKLRSQLKLDPPPRWEFIPAEIILRDPLLWNEHLTINRGLSHGVTNGAAVMTITPDGRPIFVGVVNRSGRYSSEIITIYNPALQFSVKLTISGATGLLNSGERHPTTDNVPVGFLPVYLNYTPGEAVVTTGFEEGIPGGIKVGEITTVENAEGPFSNALHLSGLVKPATQLNSIRFLLIAHRKQEKGAGAAQ